MEPFDMRARTLSAPLPRDFTATGQECGAAIAAQFKEQCTGAGPEKVDAFLASMEEGVTRAQKQMRDSGASKREVAYWEGALMAEFRPHIQAWLKAENERLGRLMAQHLGFLPGGGVRIGGGPTRRRLPGR